MLSIGRREQKAIDEAAVQAGLPSLLLMEEAGRQVADKILATYQKPPKRCDIFCGKGNNGGDGYVVARLLAERGYQPRVWELAAPAEGEETDAALMRLALCGQGILPQAAALFLVEIPSARALFDQSTDDWLIVDALLGSGYRAEIPMREELRRLTRKIRELSTLASVRIVSVDLPSGVDADLGTADAEAIQANQTVSFLYPKTGLYVWPGRGLSGEISCAGLGLSPDFLQNIWVKDLREASRYLPQIVDLDFVRKLAPRRAADAHKGIFGTAFLFCGSRDMAGAALLALRACAAAGAGLLRAAIVEDLYAACLAALPSALWLSWPSERGASFEKMEGELAQADAVLIGSGLAAFPASHLQELLRLALHSSLPLVLDAEALNRLAACADDFLPLLQQRGAETVLTPHPGEFRRLAAAFHIRAEDRLSAARELARLLGLHVILKGAGTIIALADGTSYINDSGNEGMAKGGSGDLLAGLITSFLAQGLAPGTALPAAVYLHGLAGDLAALAKGKRSMSVEDCLEQLPEALRLCSWT